MSNAELFLPGRLRELRNGNSQAEIARLCGIPQQNYNRYEAGTVKPKQDALRKIATHYGLTIEQLLDGHCPDHAHTVTAETPTTLERENAFLREEIKQKDVEILNLKLKLNEACAANGKGTG